MSMIPEFSFLPPEINSARIFAGAGSGPLFLAAQAWDSLAADLAGSASSFDSVIAGLAGGPWAGPASVAMAAAATPYVGWLSAAAGQAALAAGQAREAATAFETALATTIHPAVVSSNRVSFISLIQSNFFGLNAPAIAANEADYIEMWAQDVGAMVGYFTGATSVASTLAPFTAPPIDLVGLASSFGAIGTEVATQASVAVAAAPVVATAVQSLVAGVPLQQIMSVAQIGMYPASMLISPMMSLAQSANGAGAGAAGLANAAAMGAADMPKLVGDIAPAAKGLGGGVGGLGGVGADLGKAHLVGAMSTPPTWQGSMPKGMASGALSGLGMNAAEMAQAAGASGMGGGMPMMPMPMGMGGGAGGGMPPGMMGRGGAGSHVVQNRPSVIPRTGV
jgi:PPE-repeat protein